MRLAGSFFDVYGFDPDFFDLGAFINGDDVVALFLGPATGDGSDATLVDLYGVIGTDGSGEPWEYTDGYSFRNPDATTDNGTFELSQWTFGGANSLEGADATESRTEFDACKTLLQVHTTSTPFQSLPQLALSGLACWYLLLAAAIASFALATRSRISKGLRFPGGLFLSKYPKFRLGGL